MFQYGTLLSKYMKKLKQDTCVFFNQVGETGITKAIECKTHNPFVWKNKQNTAIT